MNSTRPIIPVALLIFIIYLPSAFCEEGTRWERWPVIDKASAEIGYATYKVYYDPNNPSHIFLFQACWLIRRDSQVVIKPNCAFKVDDGKLYFDKTWRTPEGYLTGVEWGDPKMGDFSLISSIFRKPRFTSESVSIYDNGQWIHIRDLPALKE